MVKRINRWALEGKDTDEMMPYLSRQLGHSTIEETYYYYHQTIDAIRLFPFFLATISSTV